MSESTMRGRVIKALKGLDAVPVENSVKSGTPDVNYIGGWIELKWTRRWPKRAGTVVRLDHFTRTQRRWLKRRYEAGGNSWLLWQVGHEWMLFHGLDAHDYVGNLTRTGLYKCARTRWTKGLHNSQLVHALTRDWEETWDRVPVVYG